MNSIVDPLARVTVASDEAVGDCVRTSSATAGNARPRRPASRSTRYGGSSSAGSPAARYLGPCSSAWGRTSAPSTRRRRRCSHCRWLRRAPLGDQVPGLQGVQPRWQVCGAIVSDVRRRLAPGWDRVTALHCVAPREAWRRVYCVPAGHPTRLGPPSSRCADSRPSGGSSARIVEGWRPRRSVYQGRKEEEPGVGEKERSMIDRRLNSWATPASIRHPARPGGVPSTVIKPGLEPGRPAVGCAASKRAAFRRHAASSNRSSVGQPCIIWLVSGRSRRVSGAEAIRTTDSRLRHPRPPRGSSARAPTGCARRRSIP